MTMTAAFKIKLFGVYARLNDVELALFVHKECNSPVPMLEGRLVRTFLNPTGLWIIAHYAWLRLSADPFITTARAAQIVVDRVQARGEPIV